MLEKNILPIACPPPTKLFGHLMVPLAILMAYPETLEWYYSNYIQLRATIQYRKHDADEDVELLNFYPNVYISHRHTDFLIVFILDSLFFTITRENLIENLIKWIDNKHYVQLYLNGAELPGTNMHATRYDRIIEVLFYGYTIQQKTFNFLAFDVNEKYSECGKLDYNYQCKYRLLVSSTILMEKRT